ncbi:Rrf2 family transcriptional regulator [Qipengyuania sp. GH25]|uniref:Rrf2 family transcriptional regulator n=1 Tax=Qipengyuania pacifica TaxID=2860199 RepID=A0ABS7JKB4_9SPHN|nr:Rrf2 family transcriptional regulator [Qipengyuania aerophila]MBX7489821.1 Rrf2 family transcriptional regulator [Qipengyuania aerophila]
MAHITTSVEYAIHGLMWLVDQEAQSMSSREIAELQGISPSFLAKIFPKLEKAGIVEAREGVRGGYQLARPADQITFLEIVDAVEGRKPLFDCQEVRGRCALFSGEKPSWATSGTCGIHAVMLAAEQAMRQSLARQTLGKVSEHFNRKVPGTFHERVREWIGEKESQRTSRSQSLRPPSTSPT